MTGRTSARADPGRTAKARSVDAAEIEKFAAMADDWWDPHGKFRPLHRLAPARLGFIRSQAERHFGLAPAARRPLAGYRVLDIGCGGGLLTEPMARLGAAAVGIDASARNIDVARAHAEAMGLSVDYRIGSAEDIAEIIADDNAARRSDGFADGFADGFDMVLNLEVVEHVADRDAFMAACAATVRPGGLMIVSTINRTPRAFALAIVGAEYVMRWLPRGTHDWRKFVKPSELARAVRPHGLTPLATTGLVYHPLPGTWACERGDIGVNYMMAFGKAA